MSSQPWIKFYPRDWRGDQALAAVSLPARGLWMEMLCIMHEASPYGHLLVGGQPVSSAVLARSVGAGVEEVQALLVELRDAGVSRETRGGVVYSKRMTDDHKRSIAGRKAKLAALSLVAESTEEKPPPSRPPSRPPTSNPTTQKPYARGRTIAPKRANSSSEEAGLTPSPAKPQATAPPFDLEAWRAEQRRRLDIQLAEDAANA